MANPAISCGSCSWPVPAEAWNRSEGVRCLGCGERVRVAAFPAVARANVGAVPEAIATEAEASCFYHAESRAVVPCDECGRFLCSLCEIEIDGRKLCPTCFENRLSSNRLEAAETRRTMHDSIALAVATWPMLLFFWPSIIGAPAALYIVIRRWRAPLSILPRTRIRFVLAALFALGEIGFIGFMIWAMTMAVRQGVPRIR